MKAEFHAVVGGIFRKRKRQLKRTDDTGCLGKERPCHGVERRFELCDGFAVKQLQALHAVLDAALIKRFQFIELRLVKAQHERLIVLIGKIQLLCECRHHVRPPDIEERLARAGLAVEACVNDTAVGFAGALADIACAFKQTDAQLVPRQRSCNGAARHAAADDGNIIHGRSLPYIFNYIHHTTRRGICQ